jgi:sugar-specific transcriptional regulator TrmB
MYDQFLPLLQEQGMSEKESLIYLVTLELGSAPASTIARKANIKRVTTYAILRDLERQQIAHALEK